MRWPFTTIRIQLLFAFLFFTGITIVLSSTAYWYLRKSEEVKSAINTIDYLHLNTHRLIRTDANFLNVELINQSFYRTQQSVFLDRRKEILETTQNDISRLLRNRQVDLLNNRDDLQRLLPMLSTYENYFQLLVEKVLERGFKDEGMEGTMRAYAHALEEEKQLPAGDILMLRRHEKDYFLRFDEQYVVKFNNKVNELLTNLSNQGMAAQGTISNLNNYRNNFLKLVEIKNELGLDNQKGLKSKLDSTGLTLQHQIFTISSNAKVREADLMGNIEMVFLASAVIAVLLSLVLSAILANRMARPMRRLSEYVSRLVQNRFEAVPEKPENYSTQDVQQLADTFTNMALKIRKQLNELDLNRAELSDQNKKLKEINQALQASEMSLQKSNDVKDKFFSIIAHDLKGPIATITAFLSMLVKYSEGFTLEETRKLAREMRGNMNNLSVLLENLLEWSRSQMGTMEFKPIAFNLSKIVYKNIELLNATAKTKGITLVNEVPDNVEVFADYNMIDFVVRNLVSNSVKFTRANGWVKVRVRTLTNYVAVDIVDNGIGMSQDEVEELFKSNKHFSRKGTQDERGTGLGLMLCNEFIDKNNGSITVKSAIGNGSTFTFTVPLIKEKVSPSKRLTA